MLEMAKGDAGSMKTPYEQFLLRWSETYYPLVCTSSENLAGIERALSFIFPQVYVDAVTQHGACTAKTELLDVICDRNLRLRDISEFTSPAEIQGTMLGWQEAGMPKGLIPIAKDCMGNLFCFDWENGQAERPEDCPIYFWDHDFNEIEEAATSFNEWLSRYNAI